MNKIGITEAMQKMQCGRADYNLSFVSQPPARNLRTRLRRMFLTVIVSIALAGTVAFVLDYAVFRVRAAANWDPYGSVTVRHYYAVLQKNGKTTFMFDPPQPWTCVNALFSHGGSLPCWYLQRHPEQRTDI